MDDRAAQIRPIRDDEQQMVLTLINEAAERYHGVIPEDCWHDPYFPADYLASEIAAGVRFFGYEADGELLGVMGIQDVDDVTLIRHAYVAPRAQRAGVGGRLLTTLLKTTDKPVLVGTWADAAWAIAFYEKHGFRRVTFGEKNRLLRRYWNISERQVTTSVVLTVPEPRKPEVPPMSAGSRIALMVAGGLALVIVIALLFSFLPESTAVNVLGMFAVFVCCTTIFRNARGLQRERALRRYAIRPSSGHRVRMHPLGPKNAADLERARQLFFQYGGNKFGMWKDGVIDEYERCGVEESQEGTWREEYVQSWQARLSVDDLTALRELVAVKAHGATQAVLDLAPTGDSYARLEFAVALTSLAKFSALFDVGLVDRARNTARAILEAVATEPVELTPAHRSEIQSHLVWLGSMPQQVRERIGQTRPDGSKPVIAAATPEEYVQLRARTELRTNGGIYPDL